MKKLMSYIVLVCFTVYSSGIAWAAPKVKIPSVDESYITAIMDSITLVEDNKMTINYDDILNILESYTEALPTIKATKVLIPKNPKLPDIKIDMGSCLSIFGNVTYNTPDTTYICNASEFVGKRVSVSFEAGDEESKAILDAYSSIFDIPDSRDLNMVTIISVDGEPIAAGAPFQLMDNYYINISVLSKTGEWEIESSKILAAGARYNIYFGLGETLKTAKTMLKNLETELSNYPDPEALISDETLDSFLQTLNYFYFALLEYYRESTTKLMDVSITRTLSISYAYRSIEYYMTYLNPGAIILDVHSLGIDVSGSDELKFKHTFGGVSTNLESFAIEALTDIVSVSTGRIFLEATKQGIPFRIVDPTNSTDFYELMSELPLYPVSELVIYNYIYPWNEGRIAICLESQVNINNSSIGGFILYDKNTGQTRYMIAGNLNGGACTNPFEGTPGEILGAIGKAIKFLDAIVVGVTGVLAGGAHIYGAAVLTNAFAGEVMLPVVAGFAGIGVVLGVVIIGAGAVITLQLLSNLFAACVLTRRGSYYV